MINGENKELTIQSTHIRKDGSKYPVESYLQKINLNGSPLLSVTAIDITEKQKKTLALLKSQEKYKGIVNTMIDVFLRVDHTGIIEMISPSVETFGYTATALQGKPAINFYANSIQREEYINEIKSKGIVNQFDAQVIANDGSLIDVLVSGKTYIDNTGGVGIESIFKDISSSKRQQRKLLENKNLLDTINNNSPDTIIITDLDLKVIYANRVVNFQYELFIGANILNFVQESDKLRILEHFNIVKNGQKTTFDLKLYGEKGNSVEYSVRVSPIIKNNKVVTNGGRVMAITSFGNTIEEALKKSYASIEKISFKKMNYRKDIGFDLI